MTWTLDADGCRRWIEEATLWAWRAWRVARPGWQTPRRIARGLAGCAKIAGASLPLFIAGESEVLRPPSGNALNTPGFALHQPSEPSDAASKNLARFVVAAPFPPAARARGLAGPGDSGAAGPGADRGALGADLAPAAPTAQTAGFATIVPEPPSWLLLLPWGLLAAWHRERLRRGGK